MNDKCNICARFLTCDRKNCKKITFVQAGLIEKFKEEEKNGNTKNNN